MYTSVSVLIPISVAKPPEKRRHSPRLEAPNHPNGGAKRLSSPPESGGVRGGLNRLSFLGTEKRGGTLSGSSSPELGEVRRGLKQGTVTLTVFGCSDLPQPLLTQEGNYIHQLLIINS